MNTAHPPILLDRTICRALQGVLVDYTATAEVLYTALLEESGIVCADAGDESMRDHGETAALAVGAYHAVQEVARRLGESHFEGLHHKGKHRHFFLSPVNERFMLLSVFGEETRLAIVNACANRAAPRLADILSGQTEAPPLPSRFDHTGTAEGDFLVAGDYFLEMGQAR